MHAKEFCRQAAYIQNQTLPQRNSSWTEIVSSLVANTVHSQETGWFTDDSFSWVSVCDHLIQSTYSAVRRETCRELRFPVILHSYCLSLKVRLTPASAGQNYQGVSFALNIVLLLPTLQLSGVKSELESLPSFSTHPPSLRYEKLNFTSHLEQCFISFNCVLTTTLGETTGVHTVVLHEEHHIHYKESQMLESRLQSKTTLKKQPGMLMLPIIQAFRKLKQETHEFKACLS